ncbi:MAG: type 4a pilus biogenesis protein PilO [bacterium]|nr:type 4a pilus biogenesis protein PilO [bacterium]
MKRFITPFIFVIVAVLLYVLQTSSHVDAIRQLGVIKAEREELRDNADQIRAQRDKIWEEQLSLISNSDRTRLDRLLPDAIDNVRLILDVEDIARAYGMVPQARSFTQEGEKAGAVSNNTKPYNTVLFAFSVRGNYDTLKRFSRDLERSLRLVDIEKITFKVDNPEDDFYTYEIVVKTYWLKEK